MFLWPIGLANGEGGIVGFIVERMHCTQKDCTHQNCVNEQDKQMEGTTVFKQEMDAWQRGGWKNHRNYCDQLPILFGVMDHGWRTWCRRGDLNPHVG